LKQLVILDVMGLGAGFLLRAIAGAVVIDVPISPWLYACTALASLFIGFGKRRNEMSLLGGQSAETRSSLSQYTIPLLDQLITIVATATLVAYTLYTATAEGLPENNSMLLTVPFVGYGLFRYLFLIQSLNLGESPEEILLADRPLQAAILLWVVASVAVLLVYRS
jgi:4-hydroxybenzoate polyprenyltransferase